MRDRFARLPSLVDAPHPSGIAAARAAIDHAIGDRSGRPRAVAGDDRPSVLAGRSVAQNHSRTGGMSSSVEPAR